MAFRIPVVAALIASLCFCLAATAQMTGGNYSTMSIERAPRIELKGGLPARMSGGVKIKLNSAEEGQPPLSITANDIEFRYDSEGAMSEVIMIGDVGIDSPQGEISSGKAVMNVSTNMVQFTENPIVNTPTIKNLRVGQIEFNLETGDSIMLDGTAESVPLSGMNGGGASGGSAVLAASDVTDWPALVAKLQAEQKAEGPTPGKRIVSLLPEQVRAVFMSMTAEQAAAANLQNEMTKHLNAALGKQSAYDEAAFKGIALDEETAALAANAERTADETRRLNRSLLEAAYPGLIKKGAAAAE